MNHIATGHTAQIYSVIETGGGNGMVTLDLSLERLVGEGAITPRAALGLSRYHLVSRLAHRAFFLAEGDPKDAQVGA